MKVLVDGRPFKGRIMIRGYVTIKNGPYRQRRVKNHFVNNALQALMWALKNSQQPFNGGWNMYLGQNLTTPTTPSMNGLSFPIGGSPGTAPNTISMTNTALTNGGEVTISATWNAGTVSGTVGEVALYADCNNNGSYSSEMVSRLSVADGDFAAFTINTGYPLIVTWTIQFVFA